MKKYIDNLKHQAEQHPIEALAVGAVVITAIAKLVDANNARVNSRSWAKEVDRRRMMSR